MLRKKKSYLIPIIGFAIIMVLGAIFLSFPISNKRDITLEKAFFTAVSATTCTALIKFTTVEQFSIIGQIIIAILMEIGAFGFLVFISYVCAILGKRMKLSDIIMINDNISSDNYNEIKQYSIFIFNLMVKVQVIGAILLGIEFLPEYGILKGIWYSIFHSISAFANAGFDLMKTGEFTYYKNNAYIQIVLSILMFLGSIGIFVIEDLKKNKFKNFKKLKLQTKIVIVGSGVLIVLPTILLKIFEPQISILNSLFIVTSARSTGFGLLNIADFSNVSKILLIILMFIGGSPASTAGGIRIVAFFVIIATIIATLRGREETIIFWRKVPDFTVKKSFTVFMLFLIILSVATIIFAYNNTNLETINIVFENVSAVTNTGLTMTDSNLINIHGDIILMLLMYIGRVGPLTLMLAFVNVDEKSKLIDYPSENLIL